MAQKDPSPDKPMVRVTDIAQMAMCERQMLFDDEYGHKRSGRVDRLRKKGIRVHKKYEQALKPVAGDRRCYVATSLFGPRAWQTEVFREYRDSKLLTNIAGRSIVQLYYWVSPAFIRLFPIVPGLQPTLRRLLTWWAERIQGSHGGSDG